MMNTLFGITVVLLGLLAWAGQTISFLAPHVAEQWGLQEPEDEVDKTLHIIESKALGLNDMLFTWILPLSGVLMIIEHSMWPYFGLVGGGIYLYFSGMIVFSRLYLQKEGIKIGRPNQIKVAYLFSGLWSASALIMIVMSYIKLS